MWAFIGPQLDINDPFSKDGITGLWGFTFPNVLVQLLLGGKHPKGFLCIRPPCKLPG